MKAITELTRTEKIRLLQMVKAGEVDIKDVQPGATIVSDPKEAFQALMMVASQPEGVTLPIVLIGAAKMQIIEFFKSIGNDQEQY